MKLEVIAAFCGTGKSYLCKNYPNKFHEIECWEYRRGDFPKNYVKDVLDILNTSNKKLFISSDPVILNELNNYDISIKLFYPSNELREEYLDRYINRTSPCDFIGAVMINWHKWLNELKMQDYCDHTVLYENQFLMDVI